MIQNCRLMSIPSMGRIFSQPSSASRQTVSMDRQAAPTPDSTAFLIASVCPVLVTIFSIEAYRPSFFVKISPVPDPSSRITQAVSLRSSGM